MAATAAHEIRRIEQEVYALASAVEVTEAQRERIDGLMASLFNILDLDVEVAP